MDPFLYVGIRGIYIYIYNRWWLSSPSSIPLFLACILRSLAFSATEARIAPASESRFPRTHAAIASNFFFFFLGGLVARYAFRRRIDKTSWRTPAKRRRSSPSIFPLSVSFLSALSAALCPLSALWFHGNRASDNERPEANDRPAEYGRAINSRNEATEKKPLVNLSSRSRAFPP